MCARETVCQCQWVPVREKSTCVRRVSECVSVCVREGGGEKRVSVCVCVCVCVCVSAHIKNLPLLSLSNNNNR